MGIRALTLLAITACSSGPTTLLLQLDGPAGLTSLDVAIGVDSSTISRHLALGGSVKLPGTLLVQLPDRALDVTLDVVGHGSGADVSAHHVVTAIPHQEVRVPMVLGAGIADLGDLAVMSDLAVMKDLAMPVPSPRVISSSYYSGGSHFPGGMSQTGFAIDTAGVVDGDLLILFANIDNGGTSVWPDPIAPGFTQLAQDYFGSDGETYDVSWKIASGEPASYSHNYGSGIGSAAAVITLIAVTGASSITPIDAFLVQNGGSTGASPTVATSTGVTSTLNNCLILYAAGADWLASPGTTSFTLPNGYTSLVTMGDHGDLGFDWTTLMVGWSAQATAGATGNVSGTMTSTLNGIPWAAMMAIAP